MLSRSNEIIHYGSQTTNENLLQNHKRHVESDLINEIDRFYITKEKTQY